MDYYNFYKVTKQTLEKMAKSKGISQKELEKYYSLTDQYCCFYKDNDLTDIGKIFAQMAFHAQNATLISNIVKFDDNYVFLKKITCNFAPQEFLNKYHHETDVVEVLRWNGYEGLIWDTSKSQEKNKDSLVIRFSKTLLLCAKYLSEFSSRDEVLEDLRTNDKSSDHKQVIQYFRGKISAGFSIALSCDFLKEFDSNFSSLVKPDIHIKDTMVALKNKERNYYRTEKREFELICEMQEITKSINEHLKKENKKEITAYQLDRMVWLVCSSRFFLHETNTKTAYLKNICSPATKGGHHDHT